MNVWHRIRALYFRTRRTLQVWIQIYRQVVSIWKMFRGARQATPQNRSHTQATINSGRTVDVDVIPPRR